MTDTSTAGTTLRVAPYTPNHEEEVANLFISGMQEYMATLVDPEKKRRFQNFLDHVVSSLRDLPPSFSLYVVLTPTNASIAMAGLSRTPKDIIENTAELSRISVDKQWRRRGVCKMLLAHVVRVAVELYRVDSLYLITSEHFESAVQAYEALGFQEVWPSERTNHFVKMVMNVADNEWWREDHISACTSQNNDDEA